MNFKVWRRKGDNSVVGYCEADYMGFEPGGDLASYRITIEATTPVMPPSLPDKRTIALSDPTVPQWFKNFIQ